MNPNADEKIIQCAKKKKKGRKKMNRVPVFPRLLSISKHTYNWNPLKRKRREKNKPKEIFEEIK